MAGDHDARSCRRPPTARAASTSRLSEMSGPPDLLQDPPPQPVDGRLAQAPDIDIAIPLPDPPARLAAILLEAPSFIATPKSAPPPSPVLPPRRIARTAPEPERPVVRRAKQPHAEPRPSSPPQRVARRDAQAGSSATQNSPARASGPSGAEISSYRSLVLAELNRRKSYPEAARAAGIQGRVVVSFSIGPSGRVTNHAVSGSSGNGVLDAAARAAVSRMALPPPPGGRFASSAALRFSLAE